MRFLIDMSLSPRLVEWLASQGHDAVHSRDIGMQRASDNLIFEKARDDNRVVLTCDLDFAEIVAFAPTSRVSVVVFRLADTAPRRIIERMAKVVGQSAPALEAGAIVIVEESRHRVRPLPLGR